MKPIIFSSLIIGVSFVTLCSCGCDDAHRQWQRTKISRTKFLHSIATAMVEYEASHGDQTPPSLDALRPIVKRLDPEGLRMDAATERFFDRAILVRDINNSSGTTHYKWIVAVLLNPKIRDSDPDIICFADKYVTNGQYSTGYGAAFLTAEEMGVFFNRELVQEVYRKDQQVRKTTTLPAKE